MPRVPDKKIKNKNNYTVSTPRKQKSVTQRATLRHVISWGSNIRPRGFSTESLYYKVGIERIFFTGGKPEIA
jgi:hypothetical protein